LYKSNQISKREGKEIVQEFKVDKESRSKRGKKKQKQKEKQKDKKEERSEFKAPLCRDDVMHFGQSGSMTTKTMSDYPFLYLKKFHYFKLENILNI
jgi:hypothetical protein